MQAKKWYIAVFSESVPPTHVGELLENPIEKHLLHEHRATNNAYHSLWLQRGTNPQKLDTFQRSPFSPAANQKRPHYDDFSTIRPTKNTVDICNIYLVSAASAAPKHRISRRLLQSATRPTPTRRWTRSHPQADQAIRASDHRGTKGWTTAICPTLLTKAAFLNLSVSTPPPAHPHLFFSLRSQGETSPSLPAGFRNEIKWGVSLVVI